MLAIDLDVQANLTQCFGYEDDIVLEEIERFGVTQEALIEQTFAKLVKPFIEYKRTRRAMPDLTGMIKKPFGQHGPHVIGADTYLGDLELDIANSTGPREMLFKAMFDLSLEGKIPGFDLSQYDVVIMDCPRTSVSHLLLLLLQPISLLRPFAWTPSPLKVCAG